MLIPFSLAMISFLLSTGTWIVYFATILRSEVPRRPVSYVIVQIISLLMSISPFFFLDGVSPIGKTAIITLALFALAMSAFFLWVLTQRKTPIGDLKVKVGDQILPFTAVTSDNTPFQTDQLAGKRILLKFFRGGW